MFITEKLKKFYYNIGTRHVFLKTLSLNVFRLGCPVRVSLDRDEDMFSSGGRHPFYAKYKVILIIFNLAPTHWGFEK